MPKRSKLSELAEREGRPAREILTEMYLKYGKQKKVAQALEIAPSTLCQTIQRLGGQEHSILIFPEETVWEKEIKFLRGLLVADDWLGMNARIEAQIAVWEMAQQAAAQRIGAAS